MQRAAMRAGVHLTVLREVRCPRSQRVITARDDTRRVRLKINSASSVTAKNAIIAFFCASDSESKTTLRNIICYLEHLP